MKIKLAKLKETKNYVAYENADGTDFRPPFKVIAKVWVPLCEFEPPPDPELIAAGVYQIYFDEDGNEKYFLRDKSLRVVPEEIEITLGEDDNPELEPGQYKTWIEE